jgi:hypothetical protein
MTAYRAHLKELDRISHLAWQAAKRHAHPMIDHRHYLLVVLESYETTAAAQSLRDHGVTAEAIVRSIETRYARLKVPAGGPQQAPIVYTLTSRAEGMAAGSGAETVEPLHVLLALLWDPDFWPESEEMRQRIYSDLVERGCALPARTLPTRDERRNWGPPGIVEADYVIPVVEFLPSLLPPWATMSFQMLTDGRARVWVTEGIDPREYIPRAIDAYRRSEATRPSPERRPKSLRGDT